MYFKALSSDKKPARALLHEISARVVILTFARLQLVMHSLVNVLDSWLVGLAVAKFQIRSLIRLCLTIYARAWIFPMNYRVNY